MAQDPAQNVDAAVVPTHVAIVMDGNGRWAAARNLPRSAGHKAGVEAVQNVIEASLTLGVKYLTLFAFSSENWRRPAQEVNFLMGLFTSLIKNRVQQLHERNIRLSFIGDHAQLATNLRRSIEYAENLTQNNTILHLRVALNYGGQWDVLQATQALMRQAAAGEVDVDQIDEASFEQYLTTANTPNPDLLIRTSGEQRLSNFLLWQLAYTELYFIDTLWPDFQAQDFEQALAFYAARQRRFGTINITPEERHHA